MWYGWWRRWRYCIEEFRERHNSRSRGKRGVGDGKMHGRGGDRFLNRDRTSHKKHHFSPVRSKFFLCRVESWWMWLLSFPCHFDAMGMGMAPKFRLKSPITGHITSISKLTLLFIPYFPIQFHFPQTLVFFHLLKRIPIIFLYIVLCMIMNMVFCNMWDEDK